MVSPSGTVKSQRSAAPLSLAEYWRTPSPSFWFIFMKLQSERSQFGVFTASSLIWSVISCSVEARVMPTFWRSSCSSLGQQAQSSFAVWALE